MNKELNNVLIARVVNKLPHNYKPIEYLMELLGISKESAYRRMRSEIPFSFGEISLLSLNLGFSVDEIIGSNKENRIFFDLVSSGEEGSKESFLSIALTYYKFIEKMINAQDGEMLVSLNRLSLLLLLEHDALFKLFYYKWIHQTSTISVNHTFSETHIPEDIQTIRENFKGLIRKLTNVNFIIDRNLFLETVREIQYYYNRKLITAEEVMILKQDLLHILRKLERLCQKGSNQYGSKYNFYLSLLDIETNTTWTSYAGSTASHFWLYSINPIVVSDPGMANTHKKWLESLKKHSVMISQSNEILQTEFIEKQREYIENIGGDLLYYE